MKSRERKRHEQAELDGLVMRKTSEAEQLQAQIKALQAEAHYLREYMVQSALTCSFSATPMSDSTKDMLLKAWMSLPSPYENVTQTELAKIQTRSLPSPPVAAAVMQQYAVTPPATPR